MAPAGHNANAQLKSIIERIENLEASIKDLQHDRSDVYAEAKGAGFDPKTIRTLIRERKMDADTLAEREALLESYRNALGGLVDLPLGRAALERVAS
jgi:uncharacterized protein (UPF0335 family)